MSITNLLNQIQGKNSRMKLLDEIESPLVGVFYVVNNTIYYIGYPISEVQSLAGIKTSPVSHCEYWKYVLLPTQLDLKRFEYDHFPRGQVFYFEDDQTYKVYCDQCIKKDHNLKSLINEKMKLSYSTEYLSDRRYYCNRCR